MVTTPGSGPEPARRPAQAAAGTQVDGRRLASRVGPGVLTALGPALDELSEGLGLPVTARRAWLEAWAASHPEWQPWAITVSAGDGSLDGAALLARRKLGPLVEVVGLGHGPSDYAALPARPHAAKDLGLAVARELAKLRSPWRLRVEQLPVDDPVAGTVAHEIAGAALVAGDGCPVTRLDHDGHADGHRMRRDQRRAAKRLARAGVAPGRPPPGAPPGRGWPWRSSTCGPRRTCWPSFPPWSGCIGSGTTPWPGGATSTSSGRSSSTAG